jgi:multiple sugar transport system ATP-binding protein
MTMADKIVVLNGGRIEQVGSPLELYNHPDNLFVAGFIGSPAMNLGYGTLSHRDGAVWVKLPNADLKVDPRSLEAHPGIENRMGEELVVGIRPNSLEAASVRGPDPDRTLRAKVEVTEMLGPETYVHFTVNRPPVVTPDIEELLADTGQDPSSLGETTNFIARVSPDARVSRGDEIELIVDCAKLHFFDPKTGARIGSESKVAASV